MDDHVMGGGPRYSRRQAFVASAGAAAALYAMGCSSGESSASGEVDVLWDWSYNGPPGKVGQFWREVRKRLAEDDSGPQIGQLSSVAFENVQQKIEAFHDSQSGPALEPWYPAWNAFIYYKQDVLAPLDDYISEEELSHWLLTRDSRFDGNYYAASVVAEIAVLAVNRKLFEGAGVEVEDRFDSYEAFLDACDRLKAAGTTPIMCGASDAFNAEKWFEFLSQRSLDTPAQYPRAVTGDEPLDGPVMGSWIDDLIVLRDEYMNPNPDEINETVATNRFLGGEAAMMLMYPAAVFDPKVSRSEFDVVGFPSGPGAFSRPIIGAGTDMQMVKYGEDLESAGQILEFIHQPEQTKLWWELTYNLPTDDRFDASVLTPTARRAWDLIIDNRDEVFPILWPDNFVPFEVYEANSNGTAQRVLAGASAAEARDAQRKVFTDFADRNPDQVEVLAEYARTIDAEVESG